MQIKDKIRQARVSASISQGEMAGILGISQQVYSNIEKGRTRKIDVTIIEAFEKWKNDTTFIVKNDTTILQQEKNNEVREQNIPIEKSRHMLNERAQNEKSLHIMIENSLELNIAHKNVTATNFKLTAMLETLMHNSSNSVAQKDISLILDPYLQLIAAGGVGKFWNDKNAGLVELGKILNEQLVETSKLHMM